MHDENQVRRFEREAQAAARLHHTNIVPVFGVSRHDEPPYFVMQYIEGSGPRSGSLRVAPTAPNRNGHHNSGRRPWLGPMNPAVARLAARPPRGTARVSADAVARSPVTGSFAAGAGPHIHDSATGAGSVETVVFPPPIVAAPTLGADSRFLVLPGSTELSRHYEPNRLYFAAVARIGLQVAEALDFANRQGVLHRDIKPSNLLLDTHGQRLGGGLRAGQDH